ncbi:MAG TPA: hypothetical protein VHB68_15245 [Steroidobacteraceae bacterium]|nr:hypothetical protein [Steroidobacteraceae bacterium]
MSAVLLAVFNDYETAQRVRVDLVRDGFPTDRVELTAACDPGRAGIEPAELPHGRFLQYFRSLFKSEADRRYAEALAERIDCGAATVTVLPRGAVETLRAAEIFELSSPVEVAHRDLESQRWEHAAAREDHIPWVKHLWPEDKGDSHCLYCRLFEADHVHH